MTAPDPQHPYSPAVRRGTLVFVSGSLSVDREFRPVQGRHEALAAALERMTERLATVDAALGDVVKLTYFVTDGTLRDEANEQYLAAFEYPRPARTFVEVSGLPYGSTVEIDAIAVTGETA
jgi:2-iminobutanoate/2-iminopropanoate deaminase